MRVLLTLHHALTADAGAPGATLALGAALEQSGCGVDYFGFEQAYGPGAGETHANHLRFPWATRRFLRHRAQDFDVIDSSTGDAWVWATRRRPGVPALLTRSHGLEHLADERKRRAAERSGPPLSRRYPLYHGGYRLWEVRRSLRASDHCVLLNEGDREYARDRLGVPGERLSVIPNGIPERLLDAPDATPDPDGPLQMAFIGRWTTYKGRHTLMEVLQRLRAREVDFRLSVLGVGEEADVLGDLSPGVRDRVEVIPRFANADLPELLAGKHVFVFPTLSEGSSVSLVEAMACSLVPVATAVGAAPELIDDGKDGRLVPVEDSEAMTTALLELARDRPALDEMRRHAQVTAREQGWGRIAARTVELYEEVLARSA